MQVLNLVHRLHLAEKRYLQMVTNQGEPASLGNILLNMQTQRARAEGDESQ